MPDDTPSYPVNSTDHDRRHWHAGYIDAMIGVPPKEDRPEMYGIGYEAGRRIFARICGETIGQAEAFFDVRQRAGAYGGADTFEADTRLLGYFGPLYRAAKRVQAFASGHPDDAARSALAELHDCTILPHDIEAAVDGPRGRDGT